MLGTDRTIGRDLSFRSVLAAFAIMALAVLARAALDPVVPALPPFVTLYPAVAVAGLICGPLSASLATAFGIAAALFLWIPPRFSFALPNATACVAIALFALASFIILWAIFAVRTQHNTAGIARQALELGLQAGGVGTWEFDLRHRRITASRAAYALHGLPASKTKTMPDDWQIGVPPDDAETARKAIQAAVADGSLATYTYRIFSPADGPRWIAARGRVVSAGGAKRLLCALVDITEQVRAQEELRLERERLRLALAAAALAVWDFDPATGEAVIDAQYATTMGLGQHVKTLSRAQIGEMIHPEDRPRVAAEHDASVANGSDYHIEYRIITQDEQIRWVVSQGKVVEGGTAPHAGRIVGIIQDVTGVKRRETELRELAAARELLIREADHRIKNSLQMVIAMLTLQLRGITDPDAAAALRWAITRVGAIAASHLALQGSEDLREVDLSVILREVCGHFAALQPAISIICRASETLMLDADRAIPLGLAVSEVLTNALRHGFQGRDDGAVTVDGHIEEGELVVSVSDDGVGMKPQNGEPGLGSRIIRALAAQLAATIHVDSSAQTGTTVTIRLSYTPAASPELTSAS
jgi:two-component sensor histidine kinase/PAS domain-containing protein